MHAFTFARHSSVTINGKFSLQLVDNLGNDHSLPIHIIKEYTCLYVSVVDCEKTVPRIQLPNFT